MLNFLRHNPKFLSFLPISKQDKHSLDTAVQETLSIEEQEEKAGTELT